ncbi:MAG: anthranilate synthase component I, partial [Gammaproteobacteria bacterium]|nr:anthranilate synthase component I [Gammaproteobacteria bacterium]
MTPEQFTQLGQEGYNHVPVVRQLVADLDTPLSCYVKVARGPYSYLLESAAQGGEKWARYSVVGLPSSYVVKIRGHEVTIEENGTVTEQFHCDDPLAYVEELQQRFSYPELEQLPIYTGGLVGYFGYDTVRYVEKRITDTIPTDTLGTPDILLMVSNDVIVFDNVLGRIHLITHADPAEPDSFESAQSHLDEIVKKLQGDIPRDLHEPAVGPRLHEADFISSYGEEAFKRDVDRIKEYIVEGDVMQVVLSQRMSVAFESDPLNLYRALRSLNPSPYMYFLDLDEFQIVSSSPEILARLDHGEVTVRPLAGTRRRGVDETEDIALEEELLADPKEIAEHLMLIDLGRNDIGKVCQTGSVEVSEMMTVERYAHVMHIASNVRGQIRDDLGAIDLLRATLPVGTLSGAPKVRAMEIIDELEPEKRGIFGGAVGYLSWNGNMDTAIAIRTAIIRDNKLYIQAGAGVVADSIPRLEWKETMNKARSIVQAAAM